MNFFKPSKKDISTSSAFSGAGALAGGILDTFNTPGEFGHIKKGLAAGSGALKYGAAGAQFGPIGAAAGAVIGGTLGFMSARKANTEASNTEAAFRVNEQRDIMTGSAQSYARDSKYGELGNNWYGYGGSMAPKSRKMIKAVNGNLKHFTEHDFTLKGPSHGDGGIDLPQYDAEVEGGESGTTISGAPYIFSKRMTDPMTGKTFTAAHKELATRAGKAEDHGSLEAQKTSSVLRSRINKLAERQELLNQLRMMKQEQSILNS